jgi:hypothetical protein
VKIGVYYSAAPLTNRFVLVLVLVYCVAPNEDLVRKHAQLGGFPANRISEVRSVIDPATAEA